MMSKSVLLVDDEETILESLANYLGKNEYDVKTAMSGEEALAKLRTSNFDLVITDLVMNGISGMEVLRETKKINSEISAFILTGYGNMESAIEALHAGADDYILKPCDADELLRKMKKNFAKQEAQKKIIICENILPMCMYCKKIRDDSGTEFGSGKWLEIEDYLYRKTGISMSHGFCPECYEKHKYELLAEL